MRGKSTTGEKTMLDAMVPALAAMEGALKAAKDPKEILLEGVEQQRMVSHIRRLSLPQREEQAIWENAVLGIRIRELLRLH